MSGMKNRLLEMDIPETGKCNLAWCLVQDKESLLVLVIETPHPVHTHSKSSLYIY